MAAAAWRLELNYADPASTISPRVAALCAAPLAPNKISRQFFFQDWGKRPFSFLILWGSLFDPAILRAQNMYGKLRHESPDIFAANRAKPRWPYVRSDDE
ncbi:MAG: hypothetical protein NTY53_13875 [Kiritimatiellaeota bacterium]|nr:hypothetical protein [Kiritimatiellota bacterium]